MAAPLARAPRLGSLDARLTGKFPVGAGRKIGGPLQPAPLSIVSRSKPRRTSAEEPVAAAETPGVLRVQRGKWSPRCRHRFRLGTRKALPPLFGFVEVVNECVAQVYELNRDCVVIVAMAGPVLEDLEKCVSLVRTELYGSGSANSVECITEMLGAAGVLHPSHERLPCVPSEDQLAAIERDGDSVEASRHDPTAYGSSARSCSSASIGGRSHNWPRKSNPVRLGSYVSRDPWGASGDCGLSAGVLAAGPVTQRTPTRAFPHGTDVR